MASSRWKGPTVLAVCSSADLDLESLRTAAAHAIVMDGTDASAHVPAIAAARPDLPLILLADMPEDEVLESLAAGADDVLPRAASVEAITRAVRAALARRSRRDRQARQKTTAIPGAPHELQAVGRLAAGLGHEFNNLLVVIEGNAELLRDRLPEGHSLRQAAETILQAGERATTLTKQLLAFGRQQTLVPAQVDINSIIADATPALRNAMGKQVRVVTKLAPGLPPVRVDAAQLKEVLSSLAATALEAMPLGGTFTIETDTFVAGEDERRRRAWLPPGRYVRLQISDTGLGVEEEALPHLFEPFYAQEGSGRGGGLTLSSVYGVIKQSGGYIWIDSRLNEGTRVTILLPQVEVRPGREEGLSGDTAALPPEGTAAEAAGAGPSVLLVEDIDSVREILKSLLEIHGFRVDAAATAERALELARVGRYDVLLTDVALPGQSGPELARTLRGTSPRLPVLFMSGHPASALDLHDLQTTRSGFLQKPFSAATLVQRLNELLEAEAPQR